MSRLIDVDKLIEEVDRVINYTPRGDIPPTAQDILDMIEKAPIVQNQRGNMERKEFKKLMEATDVLYHMIWRHPSGGYYKDGKEYVCTNQIETDEDIKRALAVVTNFVNKILGEENEDRRSN